MPEIDYYDEYYTRLKEEFEHSKSDFPRDFNLGIHGDGDYYLPMNYRGYRLSLVYSSERSRSYGGDFTGFIVEVFLR